MSRFDDLYDYEDTAIPWGLWESILSRALAGQRGQQALAEIEEALVALPEKKLIEGHLAAEGSVCTVGAYVAHKRAKKQGITLEDAIVAITPSDPDDYEPVHDTAEVGRAWGLRWVVAWHMAYLNDEKFAGASADERYRLMLAWVRRAQGKPVDEAVVA